MRVIFEASIKASGPKRVRLKITRLLRFGLDWCVDVNKALKNWVTLTERLNV